MRTVTSTIQDNNGNISRSLSDSRIGRFRVLSNSVVINGHVDTGSIGHDLSLATNGYVWSIYSAKDKSVRRDLGQTNMHRPSPMEEPSDGKIHTEVHVINQLKIANKVSLSVTQSRLIHNGQPCFISAKVD